MFHVATVPYGVKKAMIISPLVTGSGAYIVHKSIARYLSGYEVLLYHPNRTFMPISLLPIGRFRKASLIHTTPDYGLFHARKNIPLVLTFHGYMLDDYVAPYSSRLQNLHRCTDLRWFTRLAIQKATLITAVSQFTANLAKKDLGFEQEVRVIYNGVDENIFFPIHRKTKKNIKVLFCGNLTQRKGAQWLIPILDKLNSRITVYYTSGLRSQKMLPNHPRLQCLGSIPHQDMPTIYQDTDILLFPTVREGMSMAALEAMACGLPLVVTDCSSFPELIDEGQGGYLCPLGDVEAFAEKIDYLAESPALRKKMGEYNRAKVEKMFTVERMAGQYRSLFEGFLG